MKRPGPENPLSIADGMIVVGAAALGLAWSRSIWQPIAGPAWLRLLTIQATPGLTASSLALVIVGFRRFRPRRLASRPGLALCLGSLTAVIASTLKFLVQYKIFFPNDSPFKWRFDWTIFVADYAGLCVAAVFLNLLLRGRSLPGTDWVDRLAYVVGLAWLATILTMNTVI